MSRERPTINRPRRFPRWQLGLVAAVALLGATLPAGSNANAGTTYCVRTAPGICPAGGIAEPNINAALGLVNSHGSLEHDTILIGPGSFEEDGMTDAAGHPVDIVGTGEGVTTLKSSAGSPATTLTIDEPNSTVSALSIDNPAGPSNTGLQLAGQATNVAISATSNDRFGIGVKFVSPSGTTAPSFIAGTIALPFSATLNTTGTTDLSDTVFGRVADSTISAQTGTQGVTAVDRTRITALTGAETSPAGGMTLDDDLITTVPEPGLTEVGILVQPPSPGGGSLAVLVRHSTVIGGGTAGSLGVSLRSEATGMASISAIVDSSIVRDFETSLSTVADGGALPADIASATIAVDYSDFQTRSAVAHNGGSTATATITPGPHVIAAAPSFAATTGPLAFQLSAGSPLIDAGNPMLGGEEASTDLLGNPRFVAGRAPDQAVSDIGAFEFQPVKPTVTATGPPTGVPGVPVALSATGGDNAPGDSVAFTWSFDDGATATGATVSHAFTTAGQHTATVTVTDLDGFSAQAPAAVAIVPAPTIAAPLGTILHLRIQPSRIVAARSGPSAVAARKQRKPGGIITYVDSQPGRTVFTVQRLAAGVRHGRFCVAPPPRRPSVRRPKPCTRPPSAAGASVTVLGSDAPRFGCGSAVAASTSTAPAVAFWPTDTLATAGARTAPSAQKRQRR